MNRRSLLRFLIPLALSLLLVFIPVSVRALDAAVEEAQFVLGKELYGMGSYAEAIAELERLLFEFETRKFADACQFYIGSSYFSMGDYGRAAERLGVVVERFRDSVYRAPSLYLMARAEYLQNRLHEAISHFTAYEKEYGGQYYADNSMYWKGEAYLDLGAREKARETFTELLKKYPDGNKADAARFKLRLMELEDKAGKGDGGDFRGKVDEELRRALAQREAEIEQLKGEIETLRASREGGRDEREREIQEKVQALISLQSLLNIKEEALNEKERRLNEAFQALRKSKGGD